MAPTPIATHRLPKAKPASYRSKGDETGRSFGRIVIDRSLGWRLNDVSAQAQDGADDSIDPFGGSAGFHRPDPARIILADRDIFKVPAEYAVAIMVHALGPNERLEHQRGFGELTVVLQDLHQGIAGPLQLERDVGGKGRVIANLGPL